MSFNKKMFFWALVATLQLNFSAPADAKSKCPSQGPRLTAKEYCDLYASEAQNQMRKYGVPASITLAQGMLESAYGSSYLAVVANNHFGIKAYRINWTGDKVYCDDDAEDEPFCKFKSVLAGYEYHSTFLRDNSRYAPLFKLDIRDYEAWALGLKSCGYATNPNYAKLLIDLIEKNHLDYYDVLDKRVSANAHKLYVTAEHHGLKYVRCIEGDDLSAIAHEFGIAERRLRYYNDLQRGPVLKQNDIIYLQKKKRKAPEGFETHVVKSGESLHSISQLYGVKVTSLMKRNHLVSATVHQGQVLQLR